jgi:hypothetical protein
MFRVQTIRTKISRFVSKTRAHRAQLLSSCAVTNLAEEMDGIAEPKRENFL